MLRSKAQSRGSLFPSLSRSFRPNTHFPGVQPQKWSHSGSNARVRNSSTTLKKTPVSRLAVWNRRKPGSRNTSRYSRLIPVSYSATSSVRAKKRIQG